ncbi:hypothetical protein F5B20DRAFT_540268 [Whalleya microplaca]|nr:hypothetical protein F5B20DRAFT_540268 [Whalleya microplaca]
MERVADPPLYWLIIVGGPVDDHGKLWPSRGRGRGRRRGRWCADGGRGRGRGRRWVGTARDVGRHGVVSLVDRRRGDVGVLGLGRGLRIGREWHWRWSLLDPLMLARHHRPRPPPRSRPRHAWLQRHLGTPSLRLLRRGGPRLRVRRRSSWLRRHRVPVPVPLASPIPIHESRVRALVGVVVGHRRCRHSGPWSLPLLLVLDQVAAAHFQLGILEHNLVALLLRDRVQCPQAVQLLVEGLDEAGVLLGLGSIDGVFLQALDVRRHGVEDVAQDGVDLVGFAVRHRRHVRLHVARPRLPSLPQPLRVAAWVRGRVRLGFLLLCEGLAFPGRGRVRFLSPRDTARETRQRQQGAVEVLLVQRHTLLRSVEFRLDGVVLLPINAVCVRARARSPGRRGFPHLRGRETGVSAATL